MQPNLLNLAPRHDGPDLEPSDHVRLSATLKKVVDLMSDGRLRTLREIATVVGCSEAGASARLRDLRKKKFGSYQVDRFRNGNCWFYRVSK